MNLLIEDDDADTEVATPQETTGYAHPTINTPYKNVQESSSEKDSSSENEEDMEASRGTPSETAGDVAATLNNSWENPEGSDNGGETYPLSTEELTILQMKQVKKNNNNNSPL